MQRYVMLQEVNPCIQHRCLISENMNYRFTFQYINEKPCIIPI